MGLVKPVTDLISKERFSGEERAEAQLALATLQTTVLSTVIGYEEKQLEAKAAIIVAETQSESWLTKSWRPITMLAFVLCVLADTFGFSAAPLPSEMWTLIQIGLGGYVAGRSLEGITGTIAPAIAAMNAKKG
jgi:hypothetical protein